MARVVAVHGINNTYSAAQVMAAAWIPALLGGVGLAGGNGLLTADDISCVFYGDVFRRPGRHLGVDGLEWLSAEDVDSDEDADLLQQWWQEASNTDSGVISPTARTLGIVDTVQAALAALSGSRFLAGASERLLILWLRQVRTYFTDAPKRQQIQQRFADAVTADTRVVVAHSLGSVVAYEALCAHPEWPITALVTLGSPLGIPTIILDRLNPPPTHDGTTLWGVWPGGIRQWTNIADRVDFVALVKALRRVFGERVVDIEIDNGVRMHDVTRYLTAKETGKAIIDGLRRLGQDGRG